MALLQPPPHSHILSHDQKPSLILLNLNMDVEMDDDISVHMNLLPVPVHFQRIYLISFCSSQLGKNVVLSREDIEEKTDP